VDLAGWAAARTRAERLAARAGTSVPDVLLAALLTALVLAELALDDVTTGAPAGVAAGVGGASLVWRRARPVPVLLVALGASLVVSATATGPFPPQLPLLVDLLVLYTAACRLSGRRALAAGAAGLVLVWAAHALTGDGDVADFLPALVWAAPWVAGRLVRRRTLEAAAEASRAALLLRARDEQAREAAARERDRIARELHDVVAHGVSLMVVQAGAERLRIADGDPRTREVLDGIERAGRAALSELRAMLGVLREPDGEDPGGPRAPQPALEDLPDLLDRVRAAGVPVTLTGAVPTGLPAGVALSAYRIVQEALTNVVKHAPGRAADVRLAVEDGAVVVEVASLLPVVPGQSTGSGRGLAGMAERAALLGGSVTTGPDGARWRVHARLPLPSGVPT
jgi:signal transduction histidine kinase